MEISKNILFVELSLKTPLQFITMVPYLLRVTEKERKVLP